MATEISKISVGIIGGNGKMGRFFASILQRAGCNVSVSDKEQAPNHSEVIRRCRAVIISVPLLESVRTASAIAPALRADQIVIDLSSLKTAAMEALRASDAEILGLHPMFSPEIGNCAGQTIIYVTERKRTLSDLFLSLLTREQAVLMESTADEHDRMMSIIQGLTHFSAVASGMALRALNVDIEKSLQYSSPVYRMRMDMIGRILAQTAELYADIALMNPHTVPVLRCLQTVSQELFKAIESGDRAGFINHFQAAAGQLGDFKQQALERSNEMIREMAHQDASKRKRGIK